MTTISKPECAKPIFITRDTRILLGRRCYRDRSVRDDPASLKDSPWRHTPSIHRLLNDVHRLTIPSAQAIREKSPLVFANGRKFRRSISNRFWSSPYGCTPQDRPFCVCETYIFYSSIPAAAYWFEKRIYFSSLLVSLLQSIIILCSYNAEVNWKISF